MPELPEVETVKRGLEKLIVGEQIAAVWHDWPKSFPNASADVEQFLINAKITGIRRRAKVLIIDLSSYYSLVIHLKMTGQLVYVGKERFGAGHPSDSLVGKLPDRSTRVRLSFQGGGELYFNDQRKFGWMRLIPTAEIDNIDFFKRVGPEPLGKDFTVREFKKRMRLRNRSTVKAALLDQTVIAGIGNIYADESLWAARIHPRTAVEAVSDAKLAKLYGAVREILTLSIKKGGSSDRNYVDAEGNKGSYLSFANVFRRDGQPCPRCSRDLKKIRVAGRGTHYCSFCQRERKVR